MVGRGHEFGHKFVSEPQGNPDKIEISKTGSEKGKPQNVSRRLGRRTLNYTNYRVKTKPTSVFQFALLNLIKLSEINIIFIKIILDFSWQDLL